ncbi:MAG: indole-3-glycerol phosphate synthase [Actinomycetota bacterium]|nr:MAG: indole-3-glycerol phosphate synthase [Actinomycetota bacterium]
MGFLTEHVAEVRQRLERRPLDAGRLQALAAGLPPARGFAAALRAASVPAVIAEVKRSSPSAGPLAEDADAAALARRYEEAGAAAVSVLTEPRHFGGSLADLRAVHLAVSVPVLRKDFLVHPDQVLEARVGGADAVLLIVAALSRSELEAMLATARDLGLDALVEVHTEAELETALRAGAEVIGVNARDLETLEVDPEGALEVLAQVPSDRVAVAESGISTRAQVEAALAAGARAVLVGEALVRAPDPGVVLRELRGAA